MGGLFTYYLLGGSKQDKLYKKSKRLHLNHKSHI